MWHAFDIVLVPHVQVYELKRGGSDMAVTKGNCVEYIHLMAHYRLNVQLHRQFQAFRSGLHSVIPAHWLCLFSQDELQVLISGARVPINVQDLRQNTAYAGIMLALHDLECLASVLVVSQASSPLHSYGYSGIGHSYFQSPCLLIFCLPNILSSSRWL